MPHMRCVEPASGELFKIGSDGGHSPHLSVDAETKPDDLSLPRRDRCFVSRCAASGRTQARFVVRVSRSFYGRHADAIKQTERHCSSRAPAGTSLSARCSLHPPHPTSPWAFFGVGDLLRFAALLVGFVLLLTGHEVALNELCRPATFDTE